MPKIGKVAIWKYELRRSSEVQEFLLPPPAIPVHAAMQGKTLTVWCEVDPTRPADEPVRFRVVGTGEVFDRFTWKHLATVMDGMFVWHVYWRTGRVVGV